MFILILISGCRRVDNVAFSEFETFGEEGWDPIRVLSFTPWPFDSISDSSDHYDIAVAVRYDPDKSPSYLPLLLKEINAEGETTTDTLRIQLKKPDGTPTGNKSLILCDATSIFRNDTTIQEGYALEIISMLPQERSYGIMNIGVLLIDHRDQPKELKWTRWLKRDYLKAAKMQKNEAN